MKVPEARKLDCGTWFIQLRLGGNSIPVVGHTAKECRDAAQLIKAEHMAGKRVQATAGRNLSLDKAIDNYIERKRNILSPSTIRGYKTIQNNRFQSVTNAKLKDISDWQRVINDEAKLCSPKTLKNSWRFVSSVLRENGITPPKLTLPQVAANERPWLDYEQITTFCSAVEGQSCEIAALMALSSLRRSEMCALTWKDVDLKKKCLLVRGAKVPNENHKYTVKNTTKNASSQRTVPILIPRLLQLLKSVDDKNGYLITVRPDTLRNQINRVCKSNNLPEVGVHGLRHSFASLAYHLGMPEKDCMRIGGWADSTTMHNIYTHIADSDMTKYQNAMTDFYKNANKNANKKSRH